LYYLIAYFTSKNLPDESCGAINSIKQVSGYVINRIHLYFPSEHHNLLWLWGPWLNEGWKILFKMVCMLNKLNKSVFWSAVSNFFEGW